MKYLVTLTTLLILAACDQAVSQDGTCIFQAQAGGSQVLNSQSQMTRNRCEALCEKQALNTTIQSGGQRPQWQCYFNDELIADGEL